MKSLQKSINFLCPVFSIFWQLVVEATFLSGQERTFEAGREIDCQQWKYEKSDKKGLIREMSRFVVGSDDREKSFGAPEAQITPLAALIWPSAQTIFLSK